MKFNDSGPMSEKEKKGLAKGVLAKSQPKEEEPDADDLEQSGTIERMNIEPAGNGYMVETHHKPKPSTKKDQPSEYRNPTKHVFTSHEEMANHVAQAFGKGKK